MPSKNDITGDSIQTGVPSVDYLDGWERIFGDKLGKSKAKTDQSLEPSSMEQKETNESSD